MSNPLFLPDVISSFVQYLGSSTDRVEQLKTIASLGHGFEGWMKFELGAWLIRNYHLVPHEDIGFEWKTKMADDASSMDKKQKQCDLWIRADSQCESYHFIELKLFGIEHQHKVIVQARWDFWYMSRIDYKHEQAKTGNLLLFSFGFNHQEHWEAQTRRSFVEAAELNETKRPIKSGWIQNDEAQGFMNWELWQHCYP